MNKKLEKLAESFDAEYIDIRSKTLGLFDARLWLFELKALIQSFRVFSVNKIVSKIYKTSATSGEAITKMYDVEYGGNRPNYMYLNSLLYKSKLELITGYRADEIKEMKILDVGAGSNELLRFCHGELGIPSEQLYGSDISIASKNIIVGDGFQGYAGRLEGLALPENYFDLIFLSYFIDYDTDQEATFRSAIKKARTGGKIVLEGLFPVRYLGLLEKDKDNYRFVTKGNSAVEDISLICNSFFKLSKEQDKKIIVEKIVRARRYISNRLGLNRRPSYFIVFKVVQ